MLEFKEEKLPFDSFIGGWYMPEALCDSIVQYHKDNKQLHFQGRQAGTVDKDVKDSIDISIKMGLDFKDKELFKNYLDKLYKMVNLYQERYIEYKESNYFGVCEQFPIQYYPPNGGFKTWHCERMEHRNRMLVFMTYLNDVENAGTEFKYQKLKTKSKKGLTLIWPTDVTHTHRGIISQSNEKYIVTGWLGYLETDMKSEMRERND